MYKQTRLKYTGLLIRPTLYYTMQQKLINNICPHYVWQLILKDLCA